MNKVNFDVIIDDRAINSKLSWKKNDELFELFTPKVHP